MANTLQLVRYGRYSLTKESDYGTVVAGSSRASVFNAINQNVWMTTFRFFGGKAGSTTPNIRPSAYTTDGSMNPQTRVGYGGLVSASTSMAGGSGGAPYSSAVIYSDNGPSNSAIMFFSAQRYALDLEAIGADFNHSMEAAALITADNEQFYDRSNPGDPPPSTFSGSPPHVEGHVTVSIEGWANVAPLTPSSGLSPVGSVNSTAPSFTANFQDLNGAYGTTSGNGVDTGDQLNQYHIQVRQVGTTTLLWDATLNAGATQKGNNQVNTGYAGSALTRGVAYEWRIQVSDQFSTWSGWSNWTQFTPANLGFVTLDNTPTGKVNAISGSTALDFHGRWTHQASAAMTQARVQLLDANGTTLQTSAAITGFNVASSASPGTIFTVTWAQTGFSALGWGRGYQYRIQGYDGSQWSDYSAPRSFTTDAAPTIPSGLTPSGSAIFTSFPLLSAAFSDADDTSATGLTGVFRITRPDATTVDVTPTYNTTTKKWEFQTSATQLNQYGSYSWKATGFDGALYSGEQTTLAAATFSASATFTYASGPVVSVSSPANNSTVTSASLPVSWSVVSGGPQAKYQVQVYLDGSTTLAYDSTVIASTATTHVIPSGFLRNGVNYDLIVTVTNATPLSGASNIVNIVVSFPAPTAPTNPHASAVKVGRDPVPSAIQFGWDQTGYSTADPANAFQAYNVYRWADGGPDAGMILFATLTSPTQTTILDAQPASGWTYSYGVTVVTQTGLDQLESPMAVASARVQLASNVFTLVGNGQTYRANLTNVTSRDHTRNVEEAVFTPRGTSDPSGTIKPRSIRSKARWWVADYAGVAISDALATAQQRYDEFDALDAQGGLVCWRGGRGKKRFGKISDLKITDELPNFYSFAFSFREEGYTEGAPVHA